MSRKLRFEYPGALYHIINRGNYRSWIFESEGARKSFEKPLFEACDYAGWKLHAFAKEARELVWAKRWKECMSILGKRKRDIAKDPKSAPWKAAIAYHLKTRQLCRNGWIAEALQMGSESGVSKLAKRVTNGEFDAATGLLELDHSLQLAAGFRENTS